MELLTSDKTFTVGDAFPGDSTPFRQPTDLLFHHHTSSVPSHPSPVIQRLPHQPPPKKLRPIRGVGKVPAELSEPLNLPLPKLPQIGDLSNALLDCPGLDFPDLGFLSHHNPSPFDGDPVGTEAVVRSDSAAANSPESGGGIWAGNAFLAAEIPAPPPMRAKLGAGTEDFREEFISENKSRRKRKRKRRMKVERFVEKVTREVMEKQEGMQKELIEMIEKMERERRMREEGWMQQQMKRARAEEEVRGRERSRTLALISLIQNLLGQDTPGTKETLNRGGIRGESPADF